MKIKYLLSALIVTFVSVSFAMETDDNSSGKFQHAPQQQYPSGMNFIPIYDVLKTVEIIPDDVREEIDRVYSTNSASITEFNPSSTRVINTGSHTIYFSGSKEQEHTIISTLGYDPYQEQTWPDDLQYDGPVIHQCTIALAQHLLKQAGLKTVETVPTWLYHKKGASIEIDDANYHLIQDTIPPRFTRFADLKEEEKKWLLRTMDMEEFYRAIRTTSFAFPDENNIWVDKDCGHILLPHIISPDNEGLGLRRKYGKAILGQDANKAKHNLRNEWDGGHRTFENIVRKYGDSEDLEEWMTLYNSDTQRD